MGTTTARLKAFCHALMFSEDPFLWSVCCKSPVLQFYNQQHFLFPKQAAEKQEKGHSGQAEKLVQPEMSAERQPQGLRDTSGVRRREFIERGKRGLEVGRFPRSTKHRLVRQAP